MRRSFFPLSALSGFVACGGRPSSHAEIAVRPPALDSAAVQDTLKHLIATYDLASGIKPGCYAVESDSGPAVSVTLREVHNARCGGDPNTAPRISSFRWDPASGRLITDRWSLSEAREDTVLRGRP